MTKTIQRFADGLLSRLVPQVEVSAASSYLETCRCEGYVRFLRRCTPYPYPGVPTICGPCNITSRC